MQAPNSCLYSNAKGLVQTSAPDALRSPAQARSCTSLKAELHDDLEQQLGWFYAADGHAFGYNR